MPPPTVIFKIESNVTESGKLFVIWTGNVKFIVYTNLFQPQAQTILDREKPKNKNGYIFLNKYKDVFTFS